MTRAFSIRRLSLFLGATLCVPAMGSTLTLTTDDHYVARSDYTPMAVIFADESLIVNVKLKVFVLPQMPSSRLHDSELAKLDASSWLAGGVDAL